MFINVFYTYIQIHIYIQLSFVALVFTLIHIYIYIQLSSVALDFTLIYIYNMYIYAQTHSGSMLSVALMLTPLESWHYEIRLPKTVMSGSCVVHQEDGQSGAYRVTMFMQTLAGILNCFLLVNNIYMYIYIYIFMYKHVY